MTVIVWAPVDDRISHPAQYLLGVLNGAANEAGYSTHQAISRLEIT
jgi:hypothetical protein